MGKWNGNGKAKAANKNMTLNLGSQRMNWQNAEGFQDTETTLYDSIMLLWFGQSVVSDSVTPWTVAGQASQSFSVSRRLLKLMSIESMMTFTISPSIAPFSFCPQFFPASESFPKSWLFTLGGQSVDIYLYNCINADTYVYLSKLIECAIPRKY